LSEGSFKFCTFADLYKFLRFIIALSEFPYYCNTFDHLQSSIKSIYFAIQFY